MTSTLRSYLEWCHQHWDTPLKLIQRGIEREGLRVSKKGDLSSKPHPQALGSALTHSFITTDYSEALLELITDPHDSVEGLFQQLLEVHQYVYANLEDELLWPSSMPCRLPQDEQIPIAQYGNSHNGRLRNIYRRGLGHRYGRSMQTIAGIHYNFSLQNEFWQLLRQGYIDQGKLNSSVTIECFKSEQYFALIRNFRRTSWLPMLLFGASPVACRSFVDDKAHQLTEVSQDTFGGAYATSLRMSDLGYKNNAQSSVSICYNTLDNYIHTLAQATSTPYVEYEKIGTKDSFGEYKQLNTFLLQIENEYYSVIRPKRASIAKERPLQALAAEGVDYIEVRSTDLDPFHPLGISEEQVRFLDCFLLTCLFNQSPVIYQQECDMINANHTRIVCDGRQPNLILDRPEGSISVVQWAKQILGDMQQVAKWLDAQEDQQSYQQAVACAIEKAENLDQTASARLYEQVKQSGISFIDWSLQQAEQHKVAFQGSLAPSEALIERHQNFAEESQMRQHQLEIASDAVSFDQFLADFVSQVPK